MEKKVDRSARQIGVRARSTLSFVHSFVPHTRARACTYMYIANVIRNGTFKAIRNSTKLVSQIRERIQPRCEFITFIRDASDSVSATKVMWNEIYMIARELTARLTS